MAQRSLGRSLLTKFMEELAASSHSSGRVLYSTRKRASVSEGRQFQSVRNSCPRLLVEKSHFRKV